MKRILFGILAAGACLLAACTTELAPGSEASASGLAAGNVPGPAVFTVTQEELPVSKAALGLNGSSRPQTFWEDGDAISVFTSADGASHSGKSYKFTTSLLSDAVSADFALAEDKAFGAGMYFASYPYQSNTRGVNYTGDGGTYRMAGLQIPAAQILAAGNFDKKAALAVAFAESGTLLAFRNATALLKFRVSAGDITGGRIEVDKGDAITGTFRADVDVSTGDLSVEPYGQTTYPYVEFTLDGSTPLSTGTDYYVAVRPLTLTSDIKVFLNGNLVKVINTSQFSTFERNRIYDLGTLSTPAVPAEKVLSFDFTGDPLTGWPRSSAEAKGKTNAAGGLACVYPLYGSDYTFTLADCSGASGAKVYWSNTKTYGHRVVFESAERYLGVPAIPGYRLTHIQCTSSQLNDAASSVSPVIGVVTGVVANLAEKTCVTGGELQTWEPGNRHETYDYALSGTAGNTVYYLYANVRGAVSRLTLRYIPTYESDEVVRVGTYNVRYITSESDSNNNWENRKGRVVRSIRENGFDVFGLQECSPDIKTWLSSELADTYTIRYFDPYSAGSTGNHESMGLAYRTDLYTLSDWHYFWLSATPAVMATNDGSKNRGGCCAVLTVKATGTRFFVMCTHGCLDADARALWASQYQEMEKLYNPGGCPSFFVGDMNAQPDDPASVEYRTYWNDAYYSKAPKTGPYCTFNAFSLERNLYTYRNHLDYVYYRGATPLRYVCNDRLYDGYYASDHLPVYADMKMN